MSDDLVNGAVERSAAEEACAHEPIHIPGGIQPNGCLFALSPDDLTVRQAAIPPDYPLPPASALIGRTIAAVLPGFPETLIDALRKITIGSEPAHLGLVSLPASAQHRAFAHHTGTSLILELEEQTTQEDLEAIVSSTLTLARGFSGATTIAELAAVSARTVRRLTGFDRVLVYRFDENWNGEVIAEDRNDRLPSYLGLHFPAADIPAQARELYRVNRLRLIPDGACRPAPIVPPNDPVTETPLDLTFCILRAVSPVHLEYMRNMGTGASMSVSLMRENVLWGLISCHNRLPATVPFHARDACDLVGRLLSQHILANEQIRLSEKRVALRSLQTQLLARMTREKDFVTGLADAGDILLELTRASGAAVLSGAMCHATGNTPGREEIENIAKAMQASERGGVAAVDSLVKVYPDGKALADVASGVLSISVMHPDHFQVLWFRPELLRSVNWGGEPGKAVEVEAEGIRIHPRKSFDRWQETVRLHASPWESADIDAAVQLRSSIVDVVLSRIEEISTLRQINENLEAYSYTISHDLRGPFRHINGYIQLLKDSEAGRLSERGNRYVDVIVNAADMAGRMVDGLLQFARLGRAAIHWQRVDMNALLSTVRDGLQPVAEGRSIEWEIHDLPNVTGDWSLLRTVWQNLLENAIKFTRHVSPAKIRISAMTQGATVQFCVADNGAGFNMAYASKLFGVFERLHRADQFEGSGIGLANVRRVIEKHGGTVWAVAYEGQGAQFYFSLPRNGGKP